jgi:magnesium transporter
MSATAVDRPGESALDATELREAWQVLDVAERLEGLRLLPHVEAEEVLLASPARDVAEILAEATTLECRTWLRMLPPDDAADVLQEAPIEQRSELLGLLDDATRREVAALLAYEEDAAGGLMNPRFARLRPDMTVDEAISYLRRQMRERIETVYYVYVVDAAQRLLGVVSFRELFVAPPERRVQDVMRTDVVTLPEEMDQEEVGRVFGEHDLPAIPVVDAEGRVKGVVTADDVLDVVEEEATEDIQKLGGMEALEAPYLDTGFWSMVRKRGGWLAVLFLGEMLTTTAMGYFEGEIAQAVVLALFIPLIISSGGNSGSQASTLVVRAMALQELQLRDWWRVVRRELAAGLALGSILALFGFIRIVGGEITLGQFGEHYVLIAVTVAVSLIGVVMLGTLAGSMLPMLLQRLGVDPASASAPFVATLVDVTGLIIYFTVASVLLAGTLL